MAKATALTKATARTLSDCIHNFHSFLHEAKNKIRKRKKSKTERQKQRKRENQQTSKKTHPYTKTITPLLAPAKASR